MNDACLTIYLLVELTKNEREMDGNIDNIDNNDNGGGADSSQRLSTRGNNNNNNDDEEGCVYPRLFMV